MKILKDIFDKNSVWASKLSSSNPDFFKDLSKDQSPEFMWIGCSDSRVPAEQITGLMPGQLFVHRNIANLVIHTDLNLLSVLQYAIDVLSIKHVIICGHYNCGGVKSIFNTNSLGLVDNWLRHLRDIKEKHSKYLDGLTGQPLFNRMCEINIIEQVLNVSETTIVQSAWDKGQPVSVHGWVYSLNDGLLKDLNVCISSKQEVEAVYKYALSKLE